MDVEKKKKSMVFILGALMFGAMIWTLGLEGY